MAFDASSPTLRQDPDQGTEPPVLMVVCGEQVSMHPLPKNGKLTIGRGEDVDVRIDDPSISRQHAVIHIGDEIEIEDLGSANGTRFHDRALGEGERARTLLGQVVDLGSALVLVQARRVAEPTLKLSTHANFETRVEELTSRAVPNRKIHFSVMRIQVEGESSSIVPRTLMESLRHSDMIALYAPGDYEILLADAVRHRSEKIGAEIRDTLEKAGFVVRLGLAHHPFDGTTADELIAKAAQALHGSEPVRTPAIVLNDPAMEDLHRLVARLAEGRISVMLFGETGVGKEVVAEAIHRQSRRASKPFVRINCAALPEALIESELFGHEKGAFTGADRAKEGLLEAAHGGTVFLDEIGDLPLSAQAKLLRAVETKQVVRVGGRDARTIDVRFVCATHKKLEKEVEAGRFREDLFFRLNGASVTIPPLRERPSEIEPLARAFIREFTSELGQAEVVLAPRALDLLNDYSWPGNIRELRNVIERAVLISDGSTIEAEDLPVDKLSIAWSTAQPSSERASSGRTGPSREVLEAALERCAGNQTRAAAELGMSRQIFVKWLGRHQIARPRKPQSSR